MTHHKVKMLKCTACSGLLHCLGRSLIFADGVLSSQQNLLLYDLLQHESLSLELSA